jgi:RNA polymerase sigma-70 factor (ECF subfamily)
MTPGGLEEICAEVVFVLFQKECAALRSFQGRSTFATWLTVVSRRVCLAKLLNQERLVPGGSRASTDVDLNALPARGSSTELAEELQCELQAMRACLPRLSPPDQFIIQCFFFEGLTYQQIADQLRITKNAVGPKLTRARSRLRRLVALHQQRISASPPPPSDPGNPKHGSKQ